MNKYIGIENELITWKKYSLHDFEKYFDEFKQSKKYISKCDQGFRDETGAKFYIDCNVLELCTPAITLNKGFATRLSDSLTASRNRVIDFGKEHDLKFTGYSMHWNISDSKRSNSTDFVNFFKGISVPFRLFATTPVSCGIASKIKTNRTEILGDSINNIDQVNATALLIGAYSYAFEIENSFPFQIHKYLHQQTPYCDEKFLRSGRRSRIEVDFQDLNIFVRISGQKYLELLYEAIEPFVKKLGTKKEIQNLQEFVYKQKKLEFDKKDLYQKITEKKWIRNKKYRPINNKQCQLTLQKENHNVPLESQLFQELIDMPHLKRLDWDYMEYFDMTNCKYIYLKNTSQIYHICKELNPKLKFPNSIKPGKTQINQVDYDKIKREIETATARIMNG